MRALQPAGAGAQRGDAERRRVVDEEVQMLELAADLEHLVEVAADQLALADLLGRDLGLLGEHARGELLRRHFEREEADHRAVDRLGHAVDDAFAIGLGGVEALSESESSLPHLESVYLAEGFVLDAHAQRALVAKRIDRVLVRHERRVQELQRDDGWQIAALGRPCAHDGGHTSMPNYIQQLELPEMRLPWFHPTPSWPPAPWPGEFPSR